MINVIKNEYTVKKKKKKELLNSEEDPANVF